jgi:hypothetical protein
MYSLHKAIIGEQNTFPFLDMLLAYHILWLINVFLTSKKLTYVDVCNCDLLPVLKQ